MTIQKGKEEEVIATSSKERYRDEDATMFYNYVDDLTKLRDRCLQARATLKQGFDYNKAVHCFILASRLRLEVDKGYDLSKATVEMKRIRDKLYELASVLNISMNSPKNEI